MTSPLPDRPSEHTPSPSSIDYQELGYRLRAAGMRARTVGLKLRFADFTTITRDATLPEATDRDSEIYRLPVQLFERCGGEGPWRLAGSRVSNLETSRQLTIFAPPPGAVKEDKLGEVRDRLRNKYGTEVLFRARRLAGSEAGHRKPGR